MGTPGDMLGAMNNNIRIAYFTMEIGMKNSIPTFAGGLGILAADYMRSCADMKVPVGCVTMCWKHGYTHQEVSADGTQTFSDVDWDPTKELQKLDTTVDVSIEGRTVAVGVWVLPLKSGKHTVPVYFLDTDLDQNSKEDREITKYLYGGNLASRIKQEVVLGIGGVRMLRALGHADIGHFHLNEGHSAFLTLELLKENDFDDKRVRKLCAFTTHTPVPAGHDVFPYDLAWNIVGNMLPWHIKHIAGDDMLSMTMLAMNESSYTCGVSKIHGKVAAEMLGNGNVDYITNGIHHPTWTSAPLRTLFDTYIPGWKEDPSLLANAHAIPNADLWKAHQKNKKALCDMVKEGTGKAFSPDILTIVAARRIVPYKQTELLYADMDRLLSVANGRLQILHSGNSHPNDSFSQGVVKHILERGKQYHGKIEIAYLPNHSPDSAAILTAGADIWLNTPERPKEASGTSGMKAAVNGGINLSILDGWWAEAYAMDPESGWRIGPEMGHGSIEEMMKNDAEDLYTQLELEILPSYYDATKDAWIERMKRSIALVSHFNSHRSIGEYLEKAWK